MSQLVVAASRSPRFWMAILFFLLPLVAAAIIDSGAEATGLATEVSESLTSPDVPFTPFPMDASTDGTLIVRKVAYPRDTTQTFTFTGDVSGTIGNGGILTVTDVPAPGTYVSTEIEPAGWFLRSIQCDDGTGSHGWYSTATFHLLPEQTLQCTFFNQQNGSDLCRVQEGSWPYGPCHAIEHDGTTVYMGSGTSMLTVDVTNPSSPQPLGSTWVEKSVRGISAANGLAYVTAAVGYDGTLIVIDATDPSDPQHLGSAAVDEPFGIDVVGGYAYVASGYWGVSVFDVMDPATPQQVGQISTTAQALDVKIAGGRAYVANAWDGLLVVDVSVPGGPTFYDSLPLGAAARGLDIAGDYAYIGCDDGLHVVFIGVGASIHEVGFFATESAQSVSVIGDLAYVADSWWGFKIIDITDPAMPRYAGSTSTPGRSEGVVAAPGNAFIAAGYSDLQVVDTSDPSLPVGVGSYLVPDPAVDLAIGGDYAYLALGYEGDILVLDIGDPQSPTEVSLFESSFAAEGLSLNGDVAFVAAGGNGLRVLEIDDPSAIVDIGGVDTPGWAIAAANHGDIVFVADGWDGLQVIDATIHTSPQLAGSAATPDRAIDVATDGGHAYVATVNAGLRIFNVASPSSPQEVGFWDGAATLSALFRVGHLVYLTAAYEGLIIIDVSDPANPIEIGRYYTYQRADDVVVAGGLAHVLSPYGGELIIDVTDPTAPIQVDEFTLLGGTAIAGARGRMFISQDEVVLEIRAPCDLIMADDLESGDFAYWSRTSGAP